ncbi:MAG: hypothetical protein EHM47_15010, partial [Ignavibacteriales bacterium]
YPFQGEYDASIFYSVINQNPEPLARYKADIGEGFQRIIDKALDKDLETRYQHIDDLLSDLRRERKVSSESIFITKDSYERSKKPKKKKYIIAASILLLLLLVFATFYLSNFKTKIFELPKHTQLTFNGNIYLFEEGTLFDRSQISPDGQFTAYVVDKGNERSIYVKDNSGEQAIEIFKGLTGITTLRWSPSGNEIFFSATIGTSWSSYIIPKLGGRIQKLEPIHFGCWSPDESLIAGIFIPDKFVILLKRETNEIVKRIKLKGSFTWLFDIDWSPKDDKIIFLTRDDKTDKYEIWSINADGSQQQKILEENKGIYSPRWSPDGNYIYYLQENEATQDLMKIEISSNTIDKAPKVIQTGLQAFGFSITRDNKKLCYTKYNESSNLWNFTYNERKNLFQSKKLTEGTSYYSQPVISPNEEEIVFVHKDNIFKMSINGESNQQLTFLNSSCYSPSWSPNGKEIAFVSEGYLYTVSSEGGTPNIFKNTVVGSQVFWQSNSEIFYHKQGNQNFYVFNRLTQENKLLVSNDSVGWVFNPRLSPDSLMIAVDWNRYPTSGLWIISRVDSSQKFLLKGNIVPLRWAKNSKEIYAVNSDKTPPEIIKVSANTGLYKVIY